MPDRFRVLVPCLPVSDHGPDAFRQIGGQWQPTTRIGRNLGFCACGQYRLHRHRPPHAGELQHPARKDERIPRHQRLHEIFLNLAELAQPAHRQRQGLGFDNRPGVEPPLQGNAAMGNPVETIPPLGQFVIAFIGLERVAAGGDKFQHGIKISAAQMPVGIGCANLLIKVISPERISDCHPDNMLGQHIKPARIIRRIIQEAGPDIGNRGVAFKHFEPVGGDQHSTADQIIAMPGPADPLQQPGRAFGCADLDHQIDISPVNAKIE
ncbi:MAG: Uncharacterised protein [SAR116 cluster bacterium MED-G04]|nr:MAG: Uncharacterised protein [SAR116 cluster bacterium MED-G04]